MCAAILLFSVGVLSPYLPQEIARPAWRGTLSFAHDTAAPVTVQNGTGAVRVDTWDGPGIRVEATLRFYVLGDGAGTRPAAFGAEAVHAAMDGETYRITAAAAPSGLSMRSDLKILVPKGTAVRIENEDGMVRVGAGCGTVTVRGLNADILVYSPGGPVDLETVNGRILLLDSAAGGQATTVNGSIYARVRGASFDAKTGNGYIGVSVLDPSVERCALTSANGAITLTLAPACRAEIDAETARGAITSELAAEPRLSAEARTRVWRGLVTGTAAPADAEGAFCRVTMRTRNGNLSIREGGS